MADDDSVDIYTSNLWAVNDAAFVILTHLGRSETEASLREIIQAQQAAQSWRIQSAPDVQTWLNNQIEAIQCEDQAQRLAAAPTTLPTTVVGALNLGVSVIGVVEGGYQVGHGATAALGGNGEDQVAGVAEAVAGAAGAYSSGFSIVQAVGLAAAGSTATIAAGFAGAATFGYTLGSLLNATTGGQFTSPLGTRIHNSLAEQIGDQIFSWAYEPYRAEFRGYHEAPDHAGDSDARPTPHGRPELAIPPDASLGGLSTHDEVPQGGRTMPPQMRHEPGATHDSGKHQLPSSLPGADFGTPHQDHLKHPTHEIRHDVVLPGHGFDILDYFGKDTVRQDRADTHSTRDGSHRPDGHAQHNHGHVGPGPTAVYPADGRHIATDQDFRIDHRVPVENHQAGGANSGANLEIYGISPEGQLGIPTDTKSDPAPVLTSDHQKTSPADTIPHAASLQSERGDGSIPAVTDKGAGTSGPGGLHNDAAIAKPAAPTNGDSGNPQSGHLPGSDFGGSDPLDLPGINLGDAHLGPGRPSSDSISGFDGGHSDVGYFDSGPPPGA